jgi:hypothetical protein
MAQAPAGAELRASLRRGVVNAAEPLPALRDLYSRHPEFRCLLAWELQHVLWSLGYTNTLEDEDAIAAAADVARMDWSGEAGRPAA